MKPRKLTKTMKEQIERRKESLAIKRELKKSASMKVYTMKTSVNAELYDIKKIPSANVRGCDTARRSMMEDRYKEPAHVRAEIERKAMSLAPAYNKGAVQYIGDKESAMCAGRKNVN